MTGAEILVIRWACIIAFVISLGAGVAMIFGFKPGNESIAKWLPRGVLFVIVGSVVGFAVTQFKVDDDHDDSGRPELVIDNRVVDSGGGPGRPKVTPLPFPNDPAPRIDDKPIYTSAGPARPDPLVGPIPEDVREWAERTLGPRPVLPADIRDRYPSCIASLKAKALADVSDADAEDCYREVDRFHMSVFVPFYKLKEPYDEKLRTQERDLRKGGIQDGELARYNYVLAENERLNLPDSQARQARQALETRVTEDLRKCAWEKCR